MKKFKLTKGIQIILLTLLILVIGAIIVEITFNNRSSAATRACGDSNCSGTMSCTNTGVGTHRWGCNVCSYIETGSCSGGSWYHKSGTSVHQKFCWACGYYYTQESCYDDDGDGSCDAGCGNDDMHTHSYTTTYEQYNDTQHKVIKTCSCGDTQETTESHTQKTQAAVAATCTTTGKTEGKYCSVCNQVIVAQETIKALGHTEAIDAAVAATCTTAGKTEGKHCSVCNEVIVAQETIKALGHDYEETVTSPTCTEKGYTTHNCTRCEDSYIDTYTDELGHSFTNYESDNNATCKADGTKTAKCDRCDETDTITDEGSKLQHTEETITGKAATCEETGLTEGTKCAECGEILTAQQEIPALGHEYEDTVTNPTCTEKGYTTHKCTRCEDSYIDTYTNELEHSFTNYESDNNATCKADGTKTAKCDRCDETDTITDEGSKLQHTEETITGKAATCEETGLTEGTKCAECGEILTAQQEIPALGHEYEDTVTNPTCTEKGYTTHNCTRCGDSYIDTYTDELGHSFTNYESDNNATCKADGTKTAKCDRCDETDTITEEGSKLQHTEESIAGKAATCEETGLTEGTKCAECGEILTVQQEIPALGHEYEDTVTNPTCTEKGYTTHNCTRCGDSYIDTYTDALGHSFTNYESDNNATCKADGTKTAKCDRCDETDTITDEGSKLQHTVETIAGKTATCEETGLTEGTKCTVCEEILVEQEIIPALGHTEVVDVRVEPTCIESGLTEGKHCSECQEILVEQEVIPALGHNYENGKCTVCGRDQYQQIEITSEKYEIDDDYISNIQPGTSVNEFKSNIETTATEIKIYNQDDEEINDDEKIGTGMRIELKNGDKTATYMIIVKGDTNGDGVANINDIFSINSHRLGVKLLTGVYLQAADVNNDGNVEVKDIFKINSYRLRGGEL